MKYGSYYLTAILWATVLGSVALANTAAAGGFLEMPDTTEVPQLERDSLLLDMDVPGVRERDPDPRAGPRLNVREFRVQGIVEYPELGIFRQEIIDKVEAIRFDMMEEDALLESGYTLDELASISDLIVEIEQEAGERHVGPLDVQRLVFHIRDQRRQRGITLGMIEMVADTITQYYRERGFILAKAYIPQQKVREGVVNLTVLLGNLGDINVENNRRYSDRSIARLFDEDLDKPVKASVIEEKLFFVNDLPGLRTQGFFEPGQQVGDSTMTVNVTEERWYNANLRVDNHGAETSGEYRLYGDFYWHNPSGYGDQLHLGVLNSYDPDNSLYGSIRYHLPVFLTRTRFHLGASNNDFVLSRMDADDALALGISGRSQVVDAGVDYHLRRSRVRNTSLHLNWARIASNISFQQDQGGFDIDNTIENIELKLRFDRLNERRRILHQGSLGITASRYVEMDDQVREDPESDQDEEPWIGAFDYTLLAFWRLPFTDTGTRVVVRTSAQYAGTSLNSINQFSLAGPNRARGYALNVFYADDGVQAGVDWIFPGFGPLRSNIQPMLFADYGFGINYDIREGMDNIEAELSNVGVGARISFGRHFRGSLSIANPVSSRNTDLEEDDSMDDGVRMYFDLQYSF